MGSGPSNGWSDPSDPDWVPGSSDFERIFGNFEFFTVPPTASFLCDATTTLVNDNTWHNCRYDTAQWDLDAQGGFISPDLHSGSPTAEAFTINTTGLYEIKARERFTSITTGYYWLQAIIFNTSTVLDKDTVPFTAANNIWTARIGRRCYLTAGQQIVFQRLAFSGQIVNLDTTSPRNFAEIHYIAREVV